MRFRTIHLGLCSAALLVATPMACGGSGAANGNGDNPGGGSGFDAAAMSDGVEAGTDASRGTGVFGSVDSGQMAVSMTDASCASSSSATTLDPLNMIVLFDRSKSMQDEGKWPTVTNALSDFIQSTSSDGLGISLGYFPLDYICSFPQYAAPAAPLSLLPAGRTALVSNIQAQQPFVEDYGGTPTLAALTGALNYAKGLSTADPTRRNVVVIATDGYPEGCLAPDDAGAPNTLDNVVSFVTAAATTEPKVKTFVIGVGSLLTSLNVIAAAGQTGSAFLVDTVGSNSEANFRAALDTVRRQAASCDFAIPASTQKIDFNNVNVVFKESPTSPDKFMEYVPTSAACATVPAGTSAWYYDDPTNPKRVYLCPATCGDIQAVGQNAAAVSVQFGCKRIDVPN